MTMNTTLSLVDQITFWIGRDVQVTVTERSFNVGSLSCIDDFTDVVTTTFYARLAGVRVSERNLVIEYVSGGTKLCHHVLVRGDNTEIVHSRTFNLLAKELYELTGVKVPTGVKIVASDDCAIDACSKKKKGGMCHRTSRTVTEIALR